MAVGRRSVAERAKASRRGRLVLLLSLGLGAVAGLAADGLDSAAGAAGATFPQPSWTDTLSSVAISSPTVARIQGVEAVVFGSEGGYLYVVNAETGANLPGWPEPVELRPGQLSAVESSPTVAHLAGPNGPATIIVGAGSTYVANQQGGLVAFHENGTVAFSFATQDIFNEWTNAPYPGGYDNGVFSTPAVGDLAGNGKLDIVFGSWDHRLYALNAKGQLLKGFPVDTEDTIWSSPALFHVRGARRRVDIFIGGDASGRDGCFGGFVYDFTYSNGTPHIAWQHCENQTIWSSPAVGVINSSGRPAVVVGTGFGETPPYKSDTDRVFAFYAKNGARVPGWPVSTAGPAFGSPAIGTLASGGVAVVDTSWCLSCSSADGGSSMVYAWSGSGALLWSQVLPGANDFASPTLVDLTGSGGNDVLVGSAGGLFPLDGSTGQFLFGTSASDPINTCSVQNAVAVADIPGADPNSGWRAFEVCGGPVEVTLTGRLFDYPLPSTPAVTPPWPMWREDPAHDGVAGASLGGG